MKKVASMIFIYIFLLFFILRIFISSRNFCMFTLKLYLIGASVNFDLSGFLYVQVGCYFSFLKMCYRHGIHEPTDSKDAMLLMFE